MFHGSQPEGNFHISQLSVLFIFGVGKPGLVYNAAGPFRIDRNIITIAVLNRRTG